MIPLHHVRRLVLGVLIAMIGAGCEKFGGAKPASPAVTAAQQVAALVPLRPAPSPVEIVAKVNDATIGKRDVELALQELKAKVQARGGTWKPLTTEQLQRVLDELVSAELSAQDALARGLSRKTDTQSRFWYSYRTFFSQEWLALQLDQLKAEVNATEVAQFYETNKRGFREPETIRVRELMVSSEDQAKTALVKLLEGVDFLAVAEQISIRPEAARGKLAEQWVMRGNDKAVFAASDAAIRSLDPVLEQAAFAIDKVGSVSNYVKGADGAFHIFQLAERKDGRQKPLTDVSDNIRNFLILQKLSEKSDGLRKKAGTKVETFPERLSAVEQP